jgi:hypothetical protein
MIVAFGHRGRYARTTLAVTALPGAAAVEAQAVFEIR